MFNIALPITNGKYEKVKHTKSITDEAETEKFQEIVEVESNLRDGNNRKFLNNF